MHVCLVLWSICCSRSIFAGLDLLDTPSLYLPSPPEGADNGAGGPLPVFKIALLEAGGRPLLSPPNVPHMVITVDTCVMVEQRRVSHTCVRGSK